MRITLSFALAVIFVILGFFGLMEAQRLPFSSPTAVIGGPGTFPNAMILIIMFLSGCLAVSELVKSYKASKGPSASVAPISILSILGIEKKQDLFRILILLATIAVYTVILEPLGFLIATPPFMLITLWLFGLKKTIYYPILAVVFPAILYFLFRYAFSIYLP